MRWQVMPKRLFELLGDPDAARAAAVTTAMLAMDKIVVADLRESCPRIRRNLTAA